jgi:hypothetical protein
MLRANARNRKTRVSEPLDLRQVLDIDIWFSGEPVREEIASEQPELRRPNDLGSRPELGAAYAERLDAEISQATGEYWRTDPQDGSGTRGGGFFDTAQLVVNDSASWVTVGLSS